MNAVSYCRVSTDAQYGDDKFGIETQKAEIEAYCAANGITLVRHYTEIGVSGTDDAADRPQLKRILNGEITNPPIQALIVYKNDRLARKVENFFGFKYMLKRIGIDVISVVEDFGDAGIYKPVYEAISAAFAELERSFINMRMSGGRDSKAAAGGYAGGRAPFGYKAVKGSKVLVVDEREAEMVRKIFYMREQEGRTMQEIADALHAEGFTARNNGRIMTSTIQYILGNRKTYEGFYKYGKSGTWVKGQHKAILKED